MESKKESQNRKDRGSYTGSLSPPRGPENLTNLTQGSQSLALGLTLTAASQLVEGSLQCATPQVRQVRTVFNFGTGRLV
jgi:hypothetical protein